MTKIQIFIPNLQILELHIQVQISVTDCAKCILFRNAFALQLNKRNHQIIQYLNLSFIIYKQYQSINNKINLNIMAQEIASSLIGFLNKKSLFNTSPDKQNIKRRQASKQAKQLKMSNSKNKLFNLDEGSKSTKNLGIKNTHSKIDNYDNQSDQQVTSLNAQSPIRYFNARTKVSEKTEPKFMRRNPQVQELKGSPSRQLKGFGQKQSNPINQQNMWAGLVNHSSSFQSARIQSIQCLENLSMKVNNQISNINYKLDMFNSKMNVMINEEFKNLRERIYEIVERTFMESQKSIRQYMKSQEELLAGDMIKMREHLEAQYVKIEHMKEDLKKPGWKKVAGQLLSSDLQQKIQQTLKSSSNVNIKHWQIGDLGVHKIKMLEENLKQIVKLNR